MAVNYLEQYFSYCANQKNLDAKTIKAYRIDLTQFTDYCDAKQVRATRNTIEAYIEYLSKQFKPATVKRKYAAMRAYFRYLVYEDIIEQNPTQKIKLQMRQENVLPRVINKADLAKLLTQAYKECSATQSTMARFAALRNCAVLELLFATGIRVSELCDITIDTLNMDEQYVRIMGKGSKERIIYIASDQVMAALRQYAGERQRKGAATKSFFVNRDGNRLSQQSVRRIINHYAKAVTPNSHFTPHMFRHSFATYLWDNCGDIYEVKNILGHSSIKTTERYVHASYQRQKDVLKAWHPRNGLIIDERNHEIK